MENGSSIVDGLRKHSNRYGVGAGHGVAMRWTEQLRAMYETSNPSEKIAIVVLLDGIEKFYETAIDAEFDDCTNNRPKRHSWINSLFRSKQRGKVTS